MRKIIPQHSTLLPADARQMLIAAASVPNLKERQRAVQEAIERVQRRYPQHFQTT
jgi:hypothetical protein